MGLSILPNSIGCASLAQDVQELCLETSEVFKTAEVWRWIPVPVFTGMTRRNDRFDKESKGNYA